VDAVAQSPSWDAPHGGSGSASGGPRGLTRKRIWAARIIAIAADGTQLVLTPFVLGGAMSPIDDVIDVVTAAALIGLVGFHWAFLPTFVAEIVPFVDLVPSWTLAVFLATRGKDRDLTRS
jgi:hypothetical protein